jgi:hypothetical protein
MYVNAKMIPIETIPGMGGQEGKRELWKGWIQVWYIWYTLRAFVNATTYPTQQFKKFHVFLLLSLFSLLSSGTFSKEQKVYTALFLGLLRFLLIHYLKS